MKRILLDDEAYDILERHKLGAQDSFSSVVKRHFGDQVNLDASAGGWADVPSERIGRLRRGRAESFGTTGDPS